jgi:hypothetical protein
MLHLQTTIDLPAPPARVWDVLTDFAAYPQWNPFITFADGDWAVDNTVAVLVGGMPLEPKVLAFDPGRELRWKGTRPQIWKLIHLFPSPPKRKDWSPDR